MKKRLAKNELRALRIFNPYGIATLSKAKLFISYTPTEYGRMSSPAHWRVVGMGFQTDPDGAWYNDGHKTFPIWGRDEKQPRLEQAFKWVSETYGINDWEKDPFGGYQIIGALAKAVERQKGSAIGYCSEGIIANRSKLNDCPKFTPYTSRVRTRTCKGCNHYGEK